MKSVATPDGALITYGYDAQGNRVKTKTNGEPTQRLIYAPGLLGPVAELETQGHPETRFIYASRINVPDYMVRGGQTFRLVTDQLGSVRFVVDSTSGEIAQEITYDPFGEVISDSAPGFQPFGFAGGLYSSETGLTHFGAREYDAGLGRWTSSDPISFAGGDSNLYGYVIQDPVNLLDPYGTDWIESAGQAGMGFGDNLTWGASARARKMFGLDGAVNKCSSAYKAGGLAGTAASFLGGYGATKAAAGAVRRSAQEFDKYQGFVKTFGGGPARLDEVIEEGRAIGNAKIRNGLIDDLSRKFYTDLLQNQISPVVAGEGIPGTNGECECP